jgi:NTE family protein
MKKNLYLFYLVLTLFSQEQNKPKVGLVLSGGGASFYAHRF